MSNSVKRVLGDFGTAVCALATSVVAYNAVTTFLPNGVYCIYSGVCGLTAAVVSFGAVYFATDYLSEQLQPINIDDYVKEIMENEVDAIIASFAA